MYKGALLVPSRFPCIHVEQTSNYSSGGIYIWFWGRNVANVPAEIRVSLARPGVPLRVGPGEFTHSEPRH